MPFGQLYQRAATALPREPRLIPTKHGGRDPTKGRQRHASQFGVTEGRYFSVSHTLNTDHCPAWVWPLQVYKNVVMHTLLNQMFSTLCSWLALSVLGFARVSSIVMWTGGPHTQPTDRLRRETN